MPRQPHKRRQSAEPRHTARSQPRGHSPADGCYYLDAQSDLPWCAVPKVTYQTRRTESHHRNGSPPGSACLQDVEVRTPLCRQRCRLLRAPISPATDPIPHEKGSQTRSPDHAGTIVKAFLERGKSRKKCPRRLEGAKM